MVLAFFKFQPTLNRNGGREGGQIYHSPPFPPEKKLFSKAQPY